MEDLKFELIPVLKDSKNLFNRLNELYQYDFSEYNLDDVDDNGIYEEYKYFDSYFIDPKRHAYYIKVNGKYAGFVLINNITLVSKDTNTNVIAEFFVMKKYRRYKIGSKVALRIFSMFPGKWEFKVLNKNSGGMPFWKNLLDENIKEYIVSNVNDEGKDFTVYNFNY
jgi:predicted acetyltransferase